MSAPRDRPSTRSWPRLGRLAGRWWLSQSAVRQDRVATMAPLVSVLMFLTAIVLAFWYLRGEELERERQSVRRDTELTQQQISLRLTGDQEQLLRLAREMSQREWHPDEFVTQAMAFMRARPDVTQMTWLGAGRRLRASRSTMLAWQESSAPAAASAGAAPPADDAGASAATRGRPAGNAASAASAASAAALRAAAAAAPTDTAGSAPGAAAAQSLLLPVDGTDTPAERAFQQARQQRHVVFSQPMRNADGQEVIQAYAPLVDRGRFSGVILVEYALGPLLRHLVPEEVARKHLMSVREEALGSLASTSLPSNRKPDADPRGGISHEVPMLPVGNGLSLRGEGWHTSIGLISNTLFWLVAALSLLTVWMLLFTWRHMSRRAQIQGELEQETLFRRAMENSMPTGMRSLDLEGRVTYVNAAFCRMSGYSEAELVGNVPPFPYWPPDRIEENMRLLRQELQGRTPPAGLEVKLMRKDGQLFDARMYVSPLIDPKGQQTGWMTSMTDITEAKRVRDQLSASHERFTTVLEGLDAGVSVVSVPQGQPLFVNRSFRLWFGADDSAHEKLAVRLEQAEPGTLSAEMAPPPGHEIPGGDAVDDMSGISTAEGHEPTSESREIYLDTMARWFEVRSRYLQWTDGRLAQLLIVTDITARRKAEELAEQQQEKAAVTSRLMTMGEMASSVAHELNQPLTAITNYCNGIVSRLESDSIAKPDLLAALRKTSSQAERAGQIIHRIRAFVKRSEPQRQPVQARDIVEDAAELAGLALRRRNVAIRVYVAQHLPILQCDPILIEQVLLNLLKNAAEAIDLAQLPASRRQIDLRVVPRHTAEEGGVIEFSVSDNGPGVPDTVIARLYDAFFSTKTDGLGIGLSLCRSIVESHHGRMRMSNLYNGDDIVGCRFAFTLPVDTADRAERERLQASAAAHAQAAAAAAVKPDAGPASLPHPTPAEPTPAP